MRLGVLANTYVTALCGADLKDVSLQTLSQELSTIADLHRQSPELRSILDNPGFQPEERKRVLGIILKKLQVSKICRDFLYLLIDKGRTRLLPEIARRLERRTDTAVGVVRVDMITAIPLKKKQLDRLVAVIGRLRGAPIKVFTHVDPDMVGGVIVRMDGKIYDGSVRHRLAAIREMFLKEAR